ncbi:MAG TPA: 16S rRNA (guanine(527)-N(7))-methyltransferase RsmG [Pseudonocardiaceae bacterium]
MGDAAPPAPPAAALVFGDRLPLAARYVALLATTGVERGLIGPREVDRLWERHVLNCAVVAAVLPCAAAELGPAVERDRSVSGEVRLVDLGSGAGLPGIPLALARPDVSITLLEPMERRVAWLREVAETLGLSVTVTRGRAESPDVIEDLGGADVVTARAVAPLARLAGWALPLLRPGGELVAMKGQTAHDEIVRDADAVRSLGGRAVRVVDCGEGVVDPLTRVVLVARDDSVAMGRTGAGPRPARRRRRS